MNSILGFLFVLSGVFVVLIILGVFWSIRSGQFDDLEGPAARILMDDDDPRVPRRRKTQEGDSLPASPENRAHDGTMDPIDRTSELR